MHLDFGLSMHFDRNLGLSEITLLFDLSLYLDRTLALAQRIAERKTKSKVSDPLC